MTGHIVGFSIRNAALGLSLAILGCGGDPTTTPVEALEDPWTNTTPAVNVVAPGQMVVGDEITIAGANFIDPEHGRIRLRMVGWFANDLGETHEVDIEVTPEWINAGQLTWRLEPNVVFDPSGERIGSFIGQVIAINEPHDQVAYETLLSEGTPTEIDVLPSIIVRQLRPESSSCGAVITSTVEGAPIELVADAIGIGQGVEGAAIEATYGFISPQFVVGYLTDTFDGIWYGDGDEIDALEGRPIDTNPTPEELAGVQGPVSFTQQIKDGSRRMSVSSRWRSEVMVNGRPEYVGLFRTGPVNFGDDSRISLINLSATDYQGNTARRTVRMEVRPIARLRYDGSQRLKQRFPAVQVSGCTPGATPATESSYSETVAESRSRSMSFNWNYSVADSWGASFNVGLPPRNPFMYNGGINFNRTLSEGYGVDVAATVSSEMSNVQGFSGQIFPGEFGAWYRQLEKWERTGMVVGTNECGVAAELGEAVLVDWVWSAELAKGTSCPPRTNLPDAGVVE